MLHDNISQDEADKNRRGYPKLSVSIFLPIVPFKKKKAKHFLYFQINKADHSQISVCPKSVRREDFRQACLEIDNMTQPTIPPPPTPPRRQSSLPGHAHTATEQPCWEAHRRQTPRTSTFSIITRETSFSKTSGQAPKARTSQNLTFTEAQVRLCHL